MKDIIYKPGDTVYYLNNQRGKVVSGIVDEISVNPPGVIIEKKIYHINAVSYNPFKVK